MLTRRRVIAAGLAVPWTVAVADRHRSPVELRRLLTETSRDRLLEALAIEIRRGLTPGDLLGALSTVACRDVSPYPDVGFKYHAVMMLQSVQQSVSGLPARHKWLPLMWGADYLKVATAQERRRGPWSLPQASLPSGAATSVEALEHALVSWNTEAAYSAAGALLDAGRAGPALQLLMCHAARDFRAIGHKTITAANAHRLTSLLGGPVAAPLVRSLVLAVQNPEGDVEPARHEYTADADWKANGERAARLPEGWARGRNDPAAARALLAELRGASPDAAVAAAVALLGDGASPHTVWEAVLTFAAELLLRRANIVAVHANTTANAMWYCYRASTGDTARRLLLLQAVAFLPRFRDLVQASRGVRSLRVDAIDPLSASGVEEIFETLADNRVRAVRQALGWLRAGNDPAKLGHVSRWHATLKNTGTHDFKLTEAMLENYGWLELPWRDNLLAASLMYANSSRAPDDAAVARARALLA